MATATADPTVNGGSSAGKTPAQLMQEQHEAEAQHHVTVEDVVDEDDIEHPPPPHAHTEDPETGHKNGASMMSEKAAGKQKAPEKAPVLDTQSDEAFPALGAATKTAAPRQPISYANLSAKSAGANGSPALGSRPTSSGAATPSSTPGAGTPVVNPAARANVLLPGRARDSFEIDNSDLDKTKPLPRVLNDVKKKFNVTVTTKSANFGKGTEFVAEGPKGRVTEALMYVSKELTLEKQVKLQIPSAVSAQIIGRGGANIKKLETQFNVRIHIDRDTSLVTKPEDVKTDTVEIRGNAAQVRQVYEQISNQVKSLQPKVDLPLRGIPPEFYPFIAGRHADRLQQMERERDVRINVPQFHTWQHQPPPRPSQANLPPAFVPHGDDHIIISGEQAAALEARLMIEQLAEELQKELLLEELVAEQILHPYIVGERGMDPLQFLQETGCAVILPPSHQETEDYHIIGPRDRLEAGRNRAEELMSKKYNRAVDLHKHFTDAPQGPERHSKALAQYLQQKAIEREFMNTHGAEIIFPQGNAASSSWNVITNDQQKAVSAGNELRKIAQAYPSSRIGLVEVDPFFHPHLERMHSSSLRENHGVHMIVPDDGSDPVILVYEGPAETEGFTIPRSKPSQDEIKTFEQALQQAQAALLSNIPHQGISVQDIEVPKKFQDKVRRFVNNEPRPTPPQAFPVQVDFGSARGGLRQPNGTSRGSPSEKVYLRGPSEADIAALRQKIEEFLQEAEQDEKERGYTTSFAFPAQYNKNLIGKQGANIKVLREKHDVEIDTREDGKVTIKGPQKKAEACKAEIEKLAKQWADEVNFAIKIDSKYHGMLVGRNGENLQKIQSKVDNAVRIDFPKASKISDDASVAESEGGGSRGQANDEIKIRGPRAKAEKVRDELLSLHQYLVDNSHTATVSVAQGQIASLIGRRGQEMEKLRADTGAQIDVPKPDGSDRVTIQIKGSKQQVEKAKQELQKRSKAFDDIVTKNLKVDRKHHRALIGSGGSCRIFYLNE
jgi:predicted PilT family ATPase